MAVAHFVKKARKNYKEHGIKKGESYYWWKFRFGGKYYSKSHPTRQQLTQSEFYSSLYDIEDRISGLTADDVEDIETEKEGIVEDINNLRDECDEHLQNMPEHLQESSEAGQTLQERIDALDNWASEIESVDTEIEESLDETERVERLQEIIEEIQSTELGI